MIGPSAVLVTLVAYLGLLFVVAALGLIDLDMQVDAVVGDHGARTPEHRPGQRDDQRAGLRDVALGGRVQALEAAAAEGQRAAGGDGQVGVRRGRIITLRPEDDHGMPSYAPRRPRTYVYRRAGDPCRICGTTIRTEVMEGRNLFWCPSCQR